MAYIEAIRQPYCDWDRQVEPCSDRASARVYTRFKGAGELIGKYCQAHAQRMVRRQQAIEESKGPASVEDWKPRAEEAEAYVVALEREREEAVFLLKCLELEDEQGRWSPCFVDGSFRSQKALPQDEWCAVCRLLNRPEIAALFPEGSTPGEPHGWNNPALVQPVQEDSK